MKNRTTLTKSLHTVSSVAKVAQYLDSMSPTTETIDTLVARAVAILEVPGFESYDQLDPLWPALVKAVAKAIQS